MSELQDENDMSGINRATPEGYKKYMLPNPHYFKAISGKAATDENVTSEFKKLRREGLVAAASVSPHCRCKFCMEGVNEPAE